MENTEEENVPQVQDKTPKENANDCNDVGSSHNTTTVQIPSQQMEEEGSSTNNQSPHAIQEEYQDEQKNASTSEDGEWKCKSCFNLNDVSHNNCQICAIPRSQPEEGIEIQTPTEWVCAVCDVINKADTEKCTACNFVKIKDIDLDLREQNNDAIEHEHDVDDDEEDDEDDEENSRDAGERNKDESWTCIICDCTNPDNLELCVLCGEKRDYGNKISIVVDRIGTETGNRNDETGESEGEGSGSGSQSENSNKEWACLACTLLNPPLAPVCSACKVKRGESKITDLRVPPAAFDKPKHPSEHWRCLMCTTLNGPTTFECDVCQSKRGMRTKSMVQRDTRGSNPDKKWKCPSCHYWNASLARECSSCQKKNPNENDNWDVDDLTVRQRRLEEEQEEEHDSMREVYTFDGYKREREREFQRSGHQTGFHAKAKVKELIGRFFGKAKSNQKALREEKAVLELSEADVWNDDDEVLVSGQIGSQGQYIDPQMIEQQVNNARNAEILRNSMTSEPTNANAHPAFIPPPPTFKPPTGTPDSQRISVFEPWTCEACTLRNSSVDSKCMACDYPRPLAKKEERVERIVPDRDDRDNSNAVGWVCKVCTYVNTPIALVCAICGNTKYIPPHPIAAPSPKRAVSLSDSAPASSSRCPAKPNVEVEVDIDVDVVVGVDRANDTKGNGESTEGGKGKGKGKEREEEKEESRKQSKMKHPAIQWKPGDPMAKQITLDEACLMMCHLSLEELAEEKSKLKSQLRHFDKVYRDQYGMPPGREVKEEVLRDEYVLYQALRALLIPAKREDYRDEMVKRWKM